MLEDEILSFFAAEKGLAKTDLPQPGTSLLQSGLVDSASMLDLLSFLESRYGISVTDDKLLPENFETVSAIARFVETKRRNSNKPTP